MNGKKIKAALMLAVLIATYNALIFAIGAFAGVDDEFTRWAMATGTAGITAVGGAFMGAQALADRSPYYVQPELRAPKPLPTPYYQTAHPQSTHYPPHADNAHPPSSSYPPYNDERPTRYSHGGGA